MSVWAVEHFVEHAFWEVVWSSPEPDAAEQAIRRAQADRADGYQARARPLQYGPRQCNIVLTVDHSRDVCETCGAKGHRYCMAGLRAKQARGELPR